MPISPELLSATKAFAEEVLKGEQYPPYSYHTYDHTCQVVTAAKEIGEKSGLTPEELDLIETAAWLHDLGYLYTYVNHEDASISMAKDFFADKEIQAADLDRVINMVDATRLDQEPRTILEEVLKDADLSNLALPEALENSEKIREEWKVFCDRIFTDDEWDRFNYRFFKDHQYYTPYAKDQMGPKKKDNAKRIKKLIKKRDQQDFEADKAILAYKLERQEAKAEKLKRKLKKAKRARPDRGIETMFRTTYRTHINLSDLADSKANILLSINSLILTFIFTSLLEKFSGNTAMIAAGFSVILVNMATIVFAILAIRPKVNSGVFTREDIHRKKTNLLFFGNFYRMNLEDFQWGINQMMNDAEYLYGSMAKDIYFLGKVLAKKFALLRIAYNIFMYGIGVSILIVAVTLFLTEGGA
ncbi:MAG: Pycsar system effector family protein [Bacteroidota bacterium]